MTPIKKPKREPKTSISFSQRVQNELKVLRKMLETVFDNQADLSRQISQAIGMINTNMRLQFALVNEYKLIEIESERARGFHEKAKLHAENQLETLKKKMSKSGMKDIPNLDQFFSKYYEQGYQKIETEWKAAQEKQEFVQKFISAFSTPEEVEEIANTYDQWITKRDTPLPPKEEVPKEEKPHE